LSRGKEGGSNGNIDGSVLAALLSQSSLNKLVPEAAKVALACSSNSIADDEERNGRNMTKLAQAKSAAGCFRVLTSLYRPTMDAACNSLLLLVAGLVVSSAGDNTSSSIKESDGANLLGVELQHEFQASVVESTLNLIRRLQLGGAANPKKIFALLSSPMALAAFARFYSISIANAHDEGTRSTDDLADTRAKALVKDILWQGFFHPTQHIEGFRSMQFAVSSIVDGKAQGNESASNPRASFEETAGAKHKKKIIMASYQDKLVANLREMIEGSTGDDTTEKNEFGGSSTHDDCVISAATILPLLIEGFVHQTRKWREDHDRHVGKARFSGKRSSKADITLLQFQLWSSLVEPLILRLKDTRKGGVTETAAAERESGISGVVELSLLRSIRQCLALLNKYDLYLPSYPDPGHLNFAYLNALSSVLLTRAQNIYGSSSASCEVLLSLRSLLETNHQLLHEKLHWLLCIAAGCLPQVSNNAHIGRSNGNLGAAVASVSPHLFGRTLICAVVATYGKLRQLDYLFAALLPQAKRESKPSSSPPSTTIDTVVVLERVIKDKRAADTIIHCVQSCPQGQIRPIWLSFDGWITKHSKARQRDGLAQGGDSTLRYVVGAFSLFLRSLRIDQHSANEIKQLCEHSMATSISSLISIDDSTSSCGNQQAVIKLRSQSRFTVHGIALCGWVVDIHTRCSFWLGVSIDDIANSSLLNGGGGSAQSGVILSCLLDAAKRYTEGGGSAIDATLIGALQHLACHRIEQLHSMIYQKDQVENVASQLSVSSVTGGSEDMITEAKLLVDFAVCAADNCVVDQEDGPGGADWSVLARTLALWAPYSNKEHVNSFSRWMFSSASLLENDIANDPVQLKQRLVALSLINDASFYENLEVSGSLLRNGIILVVELVKAAVSGGVDVSSRKTRIRSNSFDSKGVLSLLCVPSDSSWQPLTSDCLVEIYENSKKHHCSARTLSAIGESNVTARALRLLRLINGLPHDLVSVTCEPLDLELLLRLDALAQVLLFSSRKGPVQYRDVFLSLASSCKAALASVLTCTASTDLTTFLSPDAQRAVLKRTYDSYSEASGLGSALSVGEQQYLLHSGKVIGKLVSMALHRFGEDGSLLQSFSLAVDSIVLQDVTEATVAAFGAKVYLLRSITTTVNTVDNGILRSRCPACQYSAQELLFGATFYKSKMWSSLVDYITEEEGVANRRSTALFCEASLLFSDLVLYATSRGDRTQDKATECEISQSFDRVFTSLARAALVADQDTTSAANLRLPLYYLIASVPQRCIQNVQSMNAPTQVLLIFKSHFQAAGGQADPLLDAAFCGIVQNMDAAQTRLLLHFLIDGMQKTACSLNIASTIHAYHLILLVAKGQEQKSEVSTVAKHFVLQALKLLYPISHCPHAGSVWTSQIRIGARFLTSAIGKKDILLFSSKDVALILGRTIGLLAPIPKKDKIGARTDNIAITTDIYCYCCAILSALLKFYPKQAYSAAPSTISVTQSLLSHALASDGYTSKTPGEDIIARSLEFAKITELLSSHKEVFKKHVIGLILFFVDSMETGMSAMTKKNMLPAIYSLLDMCSKHEMHQIQVTMTPSSKSLFRSVFKGYQKLQYKGQY